MKKTNMSELSSVILLISMGVLLAASVATPAAGGCGSLVWEYEDSSWIEGFRLYQGYPDAADAVTTIDPALRELPCADSNLVPGFDPITMTAFRDDDESPHSEPARFSLAAPVEIRFYISAP